MSFSRAAMASLAAICAFTFAAQAVCAAQTARVPPRPVSIATLLRKLGSLSWLASAPEWTSRLTSSRDPSGGNADFGNFVAIQGDTATLADIGGPGAVVRIWSANPTSGAVRIYIDGNPAPVVQMPFDQMLSGETPPFVAPLTQSTMGGHWTYFPIPFAKHCRITLDNPGKLYYQINSIRFAAGTSVRSFSLPLVDGDEAALYDAATAWSAPYAILPVSDEILTVAPGQTGRFRPFRGPATIKELVVKAQGASDLELRRLVLRIAFDRHAVPDIEAPLADFFGDAYGRKVFDSLALTQTPDGDMVCRLPMPFAHIAEASIENGNDRPVAVSIAAGVAPSHFIPGRDLYLHAEFYQDLTVHGRPHVWAKAQRQAGRFVGVVQAMECPCGLGFLEGDDQFRADTEPLAPCRVPTTIVAPWNGTGTEDFFNSGWYFTGALQAAPLHACLARDDLGQIDALRFLLLDAPTFRKSLDAQIEQGAENDFRDGAYYSSVAFWYGGGARTPIAKMPPASTLALPRSPLPRLVLTGPGVVEGESLVRDAKPAHGVVVAQSMLFFDGAWSRGGQLFWQQGAVGDTLVLAAAPPAAGTYHITAYLTRAPDYGTFAFSIAGQPLAVSFDAYHPTVVNSGPVDLGTATLPAGPSPFVVTVTGSNPASRAEFFGLDALVLTPVAPQEP